MVIGNLSLLLPSHSTPFPFSATNMQRARNAARNAPFTHFDLGTYLNTASNNEGIGEASDCRKEQGHVLCHMP